MNSLLLLTTLALLVLTSAGSYFPTSSVGHGICLNDPSLPAVSTSSSRGLSRIDPEATDDKRKLPIFFFHGLGASSEDGANIQANATAEGRPFVALSFCERECSLKALNLQVPMAVAAVREIVAQDSRFGNGYIFIGHSMGGLLARAVIEQMNDHKVHTFVSLAGGLSGIFYGPQDADRVPVQFLQEGFGTKILPPEVFDFAGYTTEGYRGKFQSEWARRLSDPELQAAYAIANLARVPVRDIWLSTNPFVPKYNNVNECSWFDFDCYLEKIRRKNNFLKIKEAHLFASAEDGVAAPWQMGHFGHYSELNTFEEIETGFDRLTIVEMHDTVEYRDDTFGLRTLDERGGLFLHTVPNVSHGCWLFDFQSFSSEGMCKFAPVYDKHLYKVIS